MRASQISTAVQPRRRGRGPASTAGPAPLVLDRYRLQRRLGSGAFGTVWMAHDERLDRPVAVKVLDRERVNGGRFEREARAAARLAHPGIVTLYEAAVDDEGAYLVSELVRGQTFDQLQEAGRLSDRDIVGIGIALCDALAHAHAHGVVHRDVKPSNVLVPERPVTPSQVAKLTDFGVARVLGGDTLTRTGDVIGTLAYMAPEQAEGREATAGADLYSLALVLYEALTGVNPVRVATAAQRARRLGAHLPPLRRQRRELPRELGQAIDMALRPRPRERGRLEELRVALATVHERLEDRPGVIAGGWSGSATEGSDADSGFEEVFIAPGARARAPREDSNPEPPAPRLRWPERGLAAVGAAVGAGWVSAQLLSPSPVAPAACALLAAALVLLVPRLGWLALSAAAIGATALQHHPGFALVLALVALTPLVLMPRSGWCWPVAVGAPALGLIGLAGAWPALAARARSTWQRAGLAATGWLWMALLGPLAGRTLYLQAPPGAAGLGGSLSQTLDQLLAPLARSGVLLGAAVWALSAAALPLLVRGGSLARDAVVAVAWAAGLLLLVGLTLAAGGSHAGELPSGAILGAFASVVVALAPSAVRARRG